MTAAPLASPISIAPLPLASLAPRMVKLTNQVVGRHRPLVFKTILGVFQLSFSAALPDYRAVASLKLRFGADQVLPVGIDSYPPAPLLTQALSAAVLDNLPPEVQTVLLETALEEVLEQCAKASRQSVSLEGVSTSDLATPDGTAIFFQLHDASGACVLRGHLPGHVATWEWVAAQLSNTPVAAARGCESVPVVCRVEVGRTRLPMHQLRDLALNDVVLLDECLDPLRGAWIILSPEIRLQAALEKRSATILNMASDPTAQPHSSAPADKTQPVNLEALPVQLVFEAGEKTIAFGELKGLKQGFTFELDGTPAKPLTIRANGKVIGAGELVQIGDKTGVRIVELAL